MPGDGRTEIAGPGHSPSRRWWGGVAGCPACPLLVWRALLGRHQPALALGPRWHVVLGPPVGWRWHVGLRMVACKHVANKRGLVLVKGRALGHGCRNGSKHGLRVGAVAGRLHLAPCRVGKVGNIQGASGRGQLHATHLGAGSCTSVGSRRGLGGCGCLGGGVGFGSHW